jgi:hypothetical protein
MDKVALGRVFSEYLSFPCQFSFHKLLRSHKAHYHYRDVVILTSIGSLGISVGVAVGYRLDDREIRVRWLALARYFSFPHSVHCPTKCNIQWTLGFFNCGVKRPGSEASIQC